MSSYDVKYQEYTTLLKGIHMISVKFEDEIWIYFQTNLSSRTRKEYWNIVKDFDRLTGHDPMKLTRKEALNYYNNLIE